MGLLWAVTGIGQAAQVSYCTLLQACRGLKWPREALWTRAIYQPKTGLMAPFVVRLVPGNPGAKSLPLSCQAFERFCGIPAATAIGVFIEAGVEADYDVIITDFKTGGSGLLTTFAAVRYHTQISDHNSLIRVGTMVLS